MNIIEYYQTIKKHIETKHPDIRIQLEQTPLNENRPGIRISRKGEKASPLLWLDIYHSSYENGKPLGETIQDILRDWKDILSQIPDIAETDINDWEKAKNQIYLSLVSQTLPLSGDILSRDYLDMKLIIRYRLVHTEQMIQSFPVPRALARQHWHIPEKEIFRTAGQNTETFFPPALFDMYRFLSRHNNPGKHTGQKPEAENIIHGTDPLPPALYILTNQMTVNGAASICYKGLLTGLYRRLGKPFYAVPSSVHEMFLYPEPEDESEKEIFSPGKIKNLIYTVNRSHVLPKERLSDSLYYYNGSELVIWETGGDGNE